MGNPGILEIKVADIEQRLIPTKRLGNAEAIEGARILLKQRDRLPQIIVVKDIGSERYLIAFGHNAVAGALMASDEEPILGEEIVRLREVTSPKVRVKDQLLTRAEFSQRLYEKAERVGYLINDEQVNWMRFHTRAAQLLTALNEDEAVGYESPTQLLEMAMEPGDEEEPPGLGRFTANSSNVIDTELLKQRMKKMGDNQEGP